MSVCGIITEYNPLHNGHIHHLNICRQSSDYIVCVMSGSFTQRGEAAIADKWQRASWAITAGADLVLELPLIYAAGSAEIFAEGAVRTLSALGCIDSLCFGSENDDKKFFTDIAACQLSSSYKELLQKKLAAGISYHKSAAQTSSELLKLPPDVLAQPNNILGIEYAKAVHKYSLPLNLVPIKRQGSGYHDKAIDSPLASASAIRQAIWQNDWNGIETATPPYVCDYFNDKPPLPDRKILETLYLGKLKLASADNLRRIDNISEGLENKLGQAAVAAVSVNELLTEIKSARYPYSRLQRIMLHTFFDITTDFLTAVRQSGPQYARVLAFNDKGRQVLKICKKKAAVPLIMKTAQYLSTKTRLNQTTTLLEKMLTLDTYAADIYSLLQGKPGGQDFIKSPLYIKNKPPCP